MALIIDQTFIATCEIQTGHQLICGTFVEIIRPFIFPVTMMVSFVIVSQLLQIHSAHQYKLDYKN